jgi:hypothetical protein
MLVLEQKRALIPSDRIRNESSSLASKIGSRPRQMSNRQQRISGVNSSGSQRKWKFFIPRNPTGSELLLNKERPRPQRVSTQNETALSNDNKIFASIQSIGGRPDRGSSQRFSRPRLVSRHQRLTLGVLEMLSANGA